MGVIIQNCVCEENVFIFNSGFSRQPINIFSTWSLTACLGNRYFHLPMPWVGMPLYCRSFTECVPKKRTNNTLNILQHHEQFALSLHTQDTNTYTKQDAGWTVQPFKDYRTQINHKQYQKERNHLTAMCLET